MQDFTRTGRRHDLMFDVAGNRSWSECGRVLTAEAPFVIVGASERPGCSTPSRIGKIRLAAVPSNRKAIFFIAKLNRADLNVLNESAEAELKSSSTGVRPRGDCGRVPLLQRGTRPRQDRDHRLTAAVGKVTPPAAASR